MKQILDTFTVRETNINKSQKEYLHLYFTFCMKQKRKDSGGQRSPSSIFAYTVYVHPQTGTGTKFEINHLCCFHKCMPNQE